jgi:hypothetical protein
VLICTPPPVNFLQNIQNIEVSVGPRFWRECRKAPAVWAGAFSLLVSIIADWSGKYANYFLRVSIEDKGVVRILEGEGA